MPMSKLKSLFLFILMSITLMLTACDDMQDTMDGISVINTGNVLDDSDENTSKEKLESVTTDKVTQATSERQTEIETTSKMVETTVKQTETETITKYIETETTTVTSQLVWISATGSKYHSINDCGNMNPKKAR